MNKNISKILIGAIAMVLLVGVIISAAVQDKKLVYAQTITLPQHLALPPTKVLPAPPENLRGHLRKPPISPAANLLLVENHVAVAEHLEDVIFNTQFLTIPTYEGSGQMVHPHVLFFFEGFLGYRYIMAMTPYPFSNNAHENPSILGSQCGIIWEVPDGAVNPVVGVPPDVRYGGYHSDPFLIRSGDVLELWFRRTLARDEEGRRPRGNNHNRVYRTVTTDLVNWSEPEIMLDCPNNTNSFMSKVVMGDGDTHRMWYANFSASLFYIETDDLINWTERIKVTASLDGLGVWHHEINYSGQRYEALFTGVDWGNWPLFRLFYATSYCGLDFGVGREIDVQGISPELANMSVHKVSFVLIDGVYQMYFTVFTPSEFWRLFYFEIAEENLYKLFIPN